MTLKLRKIKEWFKRLFRKKSLLLNSGTNVEDNIEKSIEEKTLLQNNKFKEELRIVESEEEKNLIKRFESGEITIGELTEDILNKINNEYSLGIKRNMEIISRVKIETN